jgi:hypothetical protein
MVSLTVINEEMNLFLTTKCVWCSRGETSSHVVNLNQIYWIQAFVFKVGYGLAGFYANGHLTIAARYQSACQCNGMSMCQHHNCFFIADIALSFAWPSFQRRGLSVLHLLEWLTVGIELLKNLWSTIFSKKIFRICRNPHNFFQTLLIVHQRCSR